jgi:hypothetical protein
MPTCYTVILEAEVAHDAIDSPFPLEGEFCLSGGGLSGLYFVGFAEFSTTYCSYPQIMGCQN